MEEGGWGLANECRREVHYGTRSSGLSLFWNSGGKCRWAALFVFKDGAEKTMKKGKER